MDPIASHRAVARSKGPSPQQSYVSEWLAGFKMTLLDERQTLDEDLYKNSKGEVTASIQLQLLKKKEEMEKK